MSKETIADGKYVELVYIVIDQRSKAVLTRVLPLKAENPAT